MEKECKCRCERCRLIVEPIKTTVVTTVQVLDAKFETELTLMLCPNCSNDMYVEANENENDQLVFGIYKSIKGI